MKNWNKTGKIKAIILVLLALPNMLLPTRITEQDGNLVVLLMPLVFGSIVIPLISKFNSAILGAEIIKPSWNDNPLILSRPLPFFHFVAYFFIIIGLSIILGTAIKFHERNFFGQFSISFGIGILLGIQLTLKTIKKK